ncbi:WecB/TagA/CpsF family glycosyltransferase [Sphingomonas sp. M1-B02]|uniref:WecB/TagA/CpsF family glycosyltransferase n=1 Tax=Sphingomonas sp. M1-B02 TaxID=3114300 RepID=UPI002240C0F6|nr:WecB/TagA/CpsF family glycosyltransferase [Sphingomonas sp. S6-11]UZK67730.1 WecB/TagA/CpsF family glycosyltransferase [Sphingomonas sp. S6-11]
MTVHVAPGEGSAPDSRRFLGFDFTTLSEHRILERIRQLADAPTFAYVVTPNVDHAIKLEAARSDAGGDALVDAYAGAALTVCDSRILLKLAAVSGIKLSLLPGSDMTRLLLETWTRPGDRVAVIGGTLEQVDSLADRWPHIRFFHHEPPMHVLRDVNAQDAIADFVEAQKCNFNFFAIGAPQSEIVAHRIEQRGRAGGVALCVGASIEFMTGVKRRAPRWIQRTSLEWAYRLGQEPRRLWRRYLLEGPRIFAIWWRQR